MKNHKQLVQAAAKWLRRKHPVVITEMASAYWEEPDAIGFSSMGSTLVECKTTRADYLADKKKVFRKDIKRGMADHRYYLTEPGLLDTEELPLGWGLLELKRSRILVAKRALPLDKNWKSEQGLLLSALRRMAVNATEGVSVRPYTFDTLNRATLGVLDDSEEKEEAPTAGKEVDAQA